MRASADDIRRAVCFLLSVLPGYGKAGTLIGFRCRSPLSPHAASLHGTSDSGFRPDYYADKLVDVWARASRFIKKERAKQEPQLRYATRRKNGAFCVR